MTTAWNVNDSRDGLTLTPKDKNGMNFVAVHTSQGYDMYTFYVFADCEGNGEKKMYTATLMADADGTYKPGAYRYLLGKGLAPLNSAEKFGLLAIIQELVETLPDPTSYGYDHHTEWIKQQWLNYKLEVES